MKNERFIKLAEFMQGCTANGEVVVGNTVREETPIVEPKVEAPILHVVEEEEVVVLPSWCKSYATGIKGEQLERPAYIKQ